MAHAELPLPSPLVNPVIDRAAAIVPLQGGHSLGGRSAAGGDIATLTSWVKHEVNFFSFLSVAYQGSRLAAPQKHEGNSSPNLRFLEFYRQIKGMNSAGELLLLAQLVDTGYFCFSLTERVLRALSAFSTLEYAFSASCLECFPSQNWCP